MRILLLEDDAMIGRTLVRALKDDGYSVDWLQDGQSAHAAINISDNAYALALLDWAVPKLSGIDLLKLIRERELGIPVLMLTARDAIEDRVAGLDAGADDYLVKPFSLDELRARIRSLIRRGGSRPDTTLRVGALQLSMQERCARYGGNHVDLTPREFALLRALIESAGTPLSRTQLEARIYGWGEEVASNAVEFLLHSLRRKLAPDAIENIRGAGWRLKADL